MNKKIYESFSWFRDDFKTTSQVGSKLRIKGKALYATVSRNNRAYVTDELVRAARTLAGKPLTVNHMRDKVIGHVFDADEEDGFIEYVAEVNDPEYVEKLRDKFSLSKEAYLSKWERNPVYGVSVDANYRFPEEDPFLEGVVAEGDRVTPKGIIFTGLSLVEDPEVPGVRGTTMELMEIMEQSIVEARVVGLLLRDAAPRLWDGYKRNIIEKLEMSEKKKKGEYAVRNEATVVFDPRAQYEFTEQDEPPAEPPCPEGEHKNDEGECVPDVVEQDESCPEGQHKNDDGECVDDMPAASEQEDCPEGQVRNEEGECVDKPEAEETLCPDGQHWSEEQLLCIEDVPEIIAPVVTSLESLRQMVRDEIHEALKSFKGGLEEKHLKETAELKARQDRDKVQEQIKKINDDLKRVGFSSQQSNQQINKQLAEIKKVQSTNCGNTKRFGDRQKVIAGSVKGLTGVVAGFNEALQEQSTKWQESVSTLQESLDKTTTVNQSLSESYDTSKTVLVERIDDITKNVEQFNTGQTEALAKLDSSLRGLITELEGKLEGVKTHLTPQFKGQVGLDEPEDRMPVMDENPYTGTP